MSHNGNKRMKAEPELKTLLAKYQELYDQMDHNPIEQAQIQKKISDCVRQLKLWQALKDAIK
jgi:hypothetical protein